MQFEIKMRKLNFSITQSYQTLKGSFFSFLFFGFLLWLPDSDVKTARDTSAVVRGRGGRGDRVRGGDAGRGARGGRGGKNAALVQTAGLFSEGTGESKLRKSSSGNLFAGI